MAKKKMGTGQEEMQTESETVEAEKHPTEEKPTEESGAEQAGEPSPKDKLPEVSEVEKVKEPSTEKKVSEEPAAGLPTVYKIVCRNKITKRIGGVDFLDGEGYTFDGYAASWFAARDGYTVESAEMGQLW